MAKEIIEVKYRKSMNIDGDGHKDYKYGYVSADIKCIKRYNNAVCMLMGINGCPHHLMEWLSDTMSESGYVHNNEITRRSFIEFHSKHGKGKTYSDIAVQKGFEKLSDEQFLIKINKGVYKVNPLMFFKDSGTEADRIKSIRYVMEFINGMETKTIVEVKK